MFALPFPTVADERKGAVVARKETEKGGMLMMTRYIALPTCDSTVVRNVCRMNVDVVFIGSLTPSNPALACR
jgi:hypothetical protein